MKKLTLDKLAFNQLRTDNRIIKYLEAHGPTCVHHQGDQMMLIKDKTGGAWLYVCPNCAAEKHASPMITITKQLLVQAVAAMGDKYESGQGGGGAVATGHTDVSGIAGDGTQLPSPSGP